MDDALTLHRFHFAFTITFHYLFPQLTMGLAGLMVIFKTLALVNSTDDFTEQPQTINGFSELFGEVFGEDGIGARSALGTNTLPGNIPVEIEVILEVK